MLSSRVLWSPVCTRTVTRLIMRYLSTSLCSMFVWTALRRLRLIPFCSQLCHLLKAFAHCFTRHLGQDSQQKHKKCCVGFFLKIPFKPGMIQLLNVYSEASLLIIILLSLLIISDWIHAWNLLIQIVINCCYSQLS